MQEYLAQLEKETSSLNEQISVLTQNITEKEAEVAAKEAEVESAQADLDKQYADMKRRIQYMYENGQNTMLSYLTSALDGGISDMLNQVEYSSNIMSYDRERLEEYEASKEALDEQYAQLQDEQEALELLKTETQEKQQKVASQQKAAGTKVSQYNEQISQMESQIGSIDDMIEEKTKLLNELIAKAEAEERAARIQAAKDAAASMDGVTIIAGDPQISRGEITLSDYEILLLATMIYCEAGNQGKEGQLAVGYVIMNRVRSALYPSSLESVLRQSRQFEPVSSGRFDLVLQAEQDDDIPNIVTQSCWDAAYEVINGTSNVDDCLFFRTWAPVPSLITNLEAGGVPYFIIKDHIFYYYWTSY
ncbi:MAG: cell wall hydrolase [Eubacteriales bacterium]|nr:cell wall hydrolase [Eubacteriales bacterium]